jgi:anthranilate phosphoribosyltransferase
MNETGFGFMFAPIHHPAMKNVAAVRKELGVRTIFNILGPLTNPAAAPNILMGVFHPDLCGIQARVMQKLGAQHALVVHGYDGLDEITIADKTLVAELHQGQIREYEISPEKFGFKRGSLDDIRVDSPQASQTMLLSVLENTPGPARDIVLLNAGAALYAANAAGNIESGVALARRVLEDGTARAKEAGLRASNLVPLVMN